MYVRFFTKKKFANFKSFSAHFCLYSILPRYFSHFSYISLYLSTFTFLFWSIPTVNYEYLSLATIIVHALLASFFIHVGVGRSLYGRLKSKLGIFCVSLVFFSCSHCSMDTDTTDSHTRTISWGPREFRISEYVHFQRSLRCA